MEKMMLDYDEEVRKFEPSPELDEADDAIYKRDLRDVMDIVKELIKNQ